MTALHFFASSVDGDRAVLVGDEARHATRVLRVRRGETISVSDGAGTVVGARVVETGAEVVAEVVERRRVEPPRPRLVVWQALPKMGKLDFVVQKLTEIGVMEIVPFAARRSVARWGEKGARNVARLRAVAREAAKQSRRAWLPAVHGVRPLEEAPPGALVLHEEAPERLGTALPPRAPADLALVVGPEGGLAPDEVERLVGAGGRPVSLGPLVLRTETAALAAAVVVLSRYGLVG